MQQSCWTAGIQRPATAFCFTWWRTGYIVGRTEFQVAAGLTPGEALFTTTVAPLRFFHLEDQHGTIGPPRLAELVRLASNPLTDLATLRPPSPVIVRWHLRDRAIVTQLRSDLGEH